VTSTIILTANAGMSRSVAMKVTLMHLQTIRKLRTSYSFILEKSTSYGPQNMAGQTYTQTSQKELWYLAWKKQRT